MRDAWRPRRRCHNQTHPAAGAEAALIAERYRNETGGIFPNSGQPLHDD